MWYISDKYEIIYIDDISDKGGGRRQSGTFYYDVKSPESVMWSNHVTAIHGLHKWYPLIIHADPLQFFWNKFKHYLNENTPIGQQCGLVAWNGETYNME